MSNAWAKVGWRTPVTQLPSAARYTGWWNGAPPSTTRPPPASRNARMASQASSGKALPYGSKSTAWPPAFNPAASSAGSAKVSAGSPASASVSTAGGTAGTSVAGNPAVWNRAIRRSGGAAWAAAAAANPNTSVAASAAAIRPFSLPASLFTDHPHGKSHPAEPADGRTRPPELLHHGSMPGYSMPSGRRWLDPIPDGRRPRAFRLNPPADLNV